MTSPKSEYMENIEKNPKIEPGSTLIFRCEDGQAKKEHLAK